MSNDKNYQEVKLGGGFKNKGLSKFIKYNNLKLNFVLIKQSKKCRH